MVIAGLVTSPQIPPDRIFGDSSSWKGSSRNSMGAEKCDASAPLFARNLEAHQPGVLTAIFKNGEWSWELLAG